MSIKHILVIRLSAMGDVAISVPVLTAFRKQYPDVRITVLTRSLYASMFSHITNCKVFTPDLKARHKGLSGLFRLFKELRIERVDAVADLHNVLRSNVLKVFFKSAGIPFEQIDKGRKEKRALTRSKNKVFRQLRPSYLRYADVFSRLGLPIEFDKLYFCPTPTLSEKVQSLVDLSKKNIGIAPFAAHLGKQYPFLNMKTVIEQLANNQDHQLFLFGGGKHEKEILDSLPKRKNIKNMVGELSFAEELQLISQLNVMVAMDSGNAHLSAMFNVPTLTLWGVTHPYAGFYPYGQPAENMLLADREAFPLIPTSVYGNKLPKGYEKAIETITEKSIFEKVTQILHTNT
ncbi:heptosyltransferase [Capnocytophaga canimorsus]|nr:heptosyltransferase [Capnocytophaga canimorsus]